MKHCQWCDKQFESQVSYKIYCSPECREQATKEKIAERYLVSRRTKRIGKDRRCKSCKGMLSVYNDEQLCTSCLVNPTEVIKELKRMKGFLSEDN
jgi:hypothetical protein